MPPWTPEHLPDLNGQTFLVTGANSGLGFHTTEALARKGATVIMGCRNAAKAGAAEEELRKRVPNGRFERITLDLGDLTSVRAAAEGLAGRPIDVLVNNAGIMAVPRTLTNDGFEPQLGTNHLGHFALTGLLLPQIRARVVNVASQAHRIGTMRWDDLMGERSYDRWLFYGQSKLANLLFTRGLHQRYGTRITAVAAHPGYAATNLQGVGPALAGATAEGFLMRVGNWMMAQPGDMGALPSIYAAAAPGVAGDEYYGPDGLFELWGHPVKVGRSARAQRAEDVDRLWTESERLTGVRYPA